MTEKWQALQAACCVLSGAATGRPPRKLKSEGQRAAEKIGDGAGEFFRGVDDD